MFSLIITIISVALVAALALATLYYGGDAFNQGRADAKAAQILSHGQQLMAAADLYKANHGVFPPNTAAIVTGGYLRSVPMAQSGATDSAWAEDQEWVMPLPGVPVFVLPSTEAPPCQRVNFRSFRMDGILAEVNESIAAQCYGPSTSASDLKTVVAKSGAYLSELVAAVSAGDPNLDPSVPLTPGDFGSEQTALPDPDADDGTWTTPPGTVVVDSGGSGGPGPGGPGPGGPGTCLAQDMVTVVPCGSDPDAPLGYCWSGDPELPPYPCPDTNTPTQPSYCVAGSTITPEEVSCDTYIATWVPDAANMVYNTTSYTVTISDGSMSGIPAPLGWYFSTLLRDSAGGYQGYGVGGSYNSSTVPPTTDWSLANSGYLQLNDMYGSIEAPVADGFGGFSGGRTWRVGGTDVQIYPLAPAGNYQGVPVQVRWPATGASSYQLCLKYQDTDSPDNMTAGGNPALLDIRPGACQ